MKEKMAKFTCMDTNTSLVSRLNLDKITARLTLRKQILGDNLGFRSLSYNLFKKQRKNGLWITKKTCNDTSGLATRGEIMALDGAAKSHNAVLTYNGYGSSSYIISSLVAYILFFMIQSFRLTAIAQYFWRIRYSLLISTNAFMMNAMISRYISGYIVVIATAVLVFLKVLQIPKFFLHYVSETISALGELLISITKCVKENQVSSRKINNTTSASPIWKLINEDDLFTLDVYSVKGFCCSLGILLVSRVLCRLFFHVVRRFYCKNDRK